jgi:hypothetical protein
VPKPLATWNRARGVWETEQVSLLCGHSEPFSLTWPNWGTTRAGTAYAQPMWEHLTADSASSSSPGLVFDTPDTNPDRPNTGSNRVAQVAGLGNQVRELLPTPTAMGDSAEVGRSHGRIAATELARAGRGDDRWPSTCC